MSSESAQRVDPPRWIPDERSRQLLRSGVSVSLATRNSALVPNLSRAIGCRLDDDGRVSVVLTGGDSVDLISDLAVNGAVAAVFSQPSTHLTLQLKANRVVIEPASETDVVAALGTRTGMLADLVRMGYPAEFSEAFMRVDVDDLVVVRFYPERAFDQTPGPQAGNPIGE